MASKVASKMIDLLIQTWWFAFLVVGAIGFAIGVPLTTRLLFTKRWATWFFMVVLAITVFGLLSMASAATYVISQPPEALLVDIPEPPSPEPGEFAPVMTFSGVYVAMVNVSILFVKPPIGYILLALLGLFVFRFMVGDFIDAVKNRA